MVFRIPETEGKNFVLLFNFCAFLGEISDQKNIEEGKKEGNRSLTSEL